LTDIAYSSYALPFMRQNMSGGIELNCLNWLGYKTKLFV